MKPERLYSPFLSHPSAGPWLKIDCAGLTRIINFADIRMFEIYGSDGQVCLHMKDGGYLTTSHSMDEIWEVVNKRWDEK